MPAILHSTGKIEDLLLQLQRLRYRDDELTIVEQRIRTQQLRWCIAAGVIGFLAIVLASDYFFTPTGIVVRVGIAVVALVCFGVGLMFRRWGRRVVYEEDADDAKLALVAALLPEIGMLMPSLDRIDADISFASYQAHGQRTSELADEYHRYFISAYVDPWLALRAIDRNGVDFRISITRHVRAVHMHCVHSTQLRLEAAQMLDAFKDRDPIIAKALHDGTLAHFPQLTILQYHRISMDHHAAAGELEFELVYEEIQFSVPSGDDAIRLEDIVEAIHEQAPDFEELGAEYDQGRLTLDGVTYLWPVADSPLDFDGINAGLEEMDLLEPLLKPPSATRHHGPLPPCFVTAPMLRVMMQVVTVGASKTKAG